MVQPLLVLAWTVALGIAHLGAAAIAKRCQEPFLWAAGPRDDPQPRYTGIAARLIRAQANFMETMPFFATAVIAATLLGRTGPLADWGSVLYLGGRVVFLPLYALGTPHLRTVAWLVSIAGLCLVLSACFVG